MKRTTHEIREHGKRMAREARQRQRIEAAARQILAEIGGAGGVVVYPRFVIRIVPSR